MDLPWNPSIVALDAVQAALVALPAARAAQAARATRRALVGARPAGVDRGGGLRHHGAAGLADGLTWLALIACPPLAAVALGVGDARRAAGLRGRGAAAAAPRPGSGPASSAATCARWR